MKPSTPSTRQGARSKSFSTVLAHSVGGVFMEWPKGTKVIATPSNKSRTLFTIKRDPPQGMTTINNVMSGVPAFALMGERPPGKGEGR